MRSAILNLFMNNRHYHFCLLKIFSLFFPVLCFSQRSVSVLHQEDEIHPFDNLSPDSVLLPIKDVLNEKIIISMGEATHGSKEFFNIKIRMFQFLAQAVKVQVFAIEAPYSGCLYINDYVLNGVGVLDTAMKKLELWPWQTEEMKNLIEWMKAYNQNKTEMEKLKFYGFDHSPVLVVIQNLHYFVKTKFQADLPGFEKQINLINNNPELKAGRRIPNKQYYDSLKKVANNLDNWYRKLIEERKSPYEEKKYEQLRFCIQEFKQALNERNSGLSYRDSCMAHSIRDIALMEQAKIFVWAHNGHITTGRKYRNSISMGGYLKEFFGDKYYAIGFIFDKGTFRAVEGNHSLVGRMFRRYILFRRRIRMRIEDFTVGTSPKGSVANVLSYYKLPCFFIDIQNSTNEYFITYQHIYNVGAIFMNQGRCLKSMILKDNFQGLVFIAVSTPSIPYLRSS